MLIAVVGPVSGAGLSAAGDANSGPQVQNVPDDESISAGENITVWERSVLRPGSIDRSSAETTVMDQEVRVDGPISERQINDDEIGVFGPEQDVNYELRSGTGADTEQFENETLQVLVVKADSNDANLSEFTDGNSTTPSTIDELTELLTSEDLPVDVTFDTFETEAVDEDGDVDATYELDGSGAYAFIGLVGDPVEVSEDSSSVTVTGETTVISADTILAHDSQSTFTPDSEYAAGENVTLDVDAQLSGENVSHAVLLFDEEEYQQQSTVINVDGELDEELRSEDITINTGFAGANGIANVDADATVMGISFADRRLAGEIDVNESSERFFGFRNAALDRVNVSAGDPVTIEEGEFVLNASITAVGNAGQSSEITVETLENWSTGDYAAVHVAADQETNEFSTSREDVTITDAEPDDPEGAAFNLTDTVAEERDLTVNETTNVSTTVENVGDAAGNVTVALSVNETVTEDDDLRETVTDLNDGATETVSVEKFFDTAGDYDVSFVALLGEEGEEEEVAHSAPVTVTVTEADDDEPTDPPSGGGSSGGSGAPPTPDDPETTVTEREGGASISTTNVQANTPTRIETGTSVTSGGTSVNAFTVDSVNDIDQLDIEVDASEEPPAETDTPDAGDALSYIDVDAGELTDDDYNSVEWEFSVSQERLDELDRDPENVRLNRYNEADEEWETFETTHEGDEEFTADAPGFSVFAITAAEPADIEVTDASLSTDAAEVGEEFDVTATLENEGEADGEKTLELLVDGAVVDTTAVTVGGGETAEHAFTTALDDEGNYEVAVNDVTAGSIDVTDTVQAGVVDDDESPFSILIAVLVIVLLAAGGLGVYYNQNGRLPWESAPGSDEDPLEE
ncbi:hypothetical protein JCM17823_10950 [Halorubrum gandharaense]